MVGVILVISRWRCRNVNNPPVITTVDNTDAVEDVLYSVDYESTDVDGGIPMWSLTTNASFLVTVMRFGCSVWYPMNGDVGSFM